MNPCLCGDPACPRCFSRSKKKRSAEDEALALLREYRDALREYHKGTPGAERVEFWKMEYRHGYYYIDQLRAVRRKEIERRIDYLTRISLEIKEIPE